MTVASELQDIFSHQVFRINQRLDYLKSVFESWLLGVLRNSKELIHHIQGLRHLLFELYPVANFEL